MHFGEAAAISTVPYIEDDLKEDRHYPSYRLGTYSVMTSRKWGSLRVTTRQLNEGLLANDATLAETLAQELHNLCKLRHPQILLLMGICPRMLVFEHIQLGSLYFYLHEKRQVPSLKSYVDILLQIVDAVIFLHGRGFLHCSLGSHAVQLVSPSIAKLGQFEYAVLDHTKETQRHTFKLLANKGRQSLYNWLSPEVLNGEPPSKRGDIFSLCSVIWELSTSLVPWQEFSPEEIVEKVVAEKAVLPLDKSTMPSHLYQLMKQGLQYSSSKRDLDLEEIRDMLLFTRREIEEDRAKRTRAITFNGEVHHVLDNQASHNGNPHLGHNQNGQGHHNGHSNHRHNSHNGHSNHRHISHHNHHGYGHAPTRPVPVRSLSSSAIQRGTMQGSSARQYDRYTGLKNTESPLKRKGFVEVGSPGGYREFSVYNDNRMTREYEVYKDGSTIEYEVYRDGSDSSTERDYSFVTNTAKRNFLRSQPNRQKGLGRRSLTSLYHNGCDVLSVSDGLDLSSGGSSRDLSGLSGSSSSSISSGSGGLRRRQIGRSADSGIRVSADSGIRVSVELGSPVRKSSASSDDRNNLRGFKFPHTYRRKSRRPLSGLDMQSSEMAVGRPNKSPDELQPHRRSRSVPRVNQFSRPDYETAIKPASHRLERHASSHRLERHASSHSVHSGSTHRLHSSTASTPKLSTVSQPKLSTTSQPKLSTVSQPKLSTASQPKLSTNSAPKLSSTSAPRLSETSQVKLSSKDPKGSNDQSLAFLSAQEEPCSQEGSQPIPPPRGTIRQLQALLLQHGTRLTSSDKTRLQKPARTGAGGLLSSFFPHTSLLFRRSKDSDAKKDDQSVKALEAGLEQPNETSPFKTANDESSRYTTVSEASSRYRTAADQVTELLRRPVASNIHRRSKEIDGKNDDTSAMQSGQTTQMQSSDCGDFASCKQSMVVKKARYSERRQSRLDSSNLLSTNLSSVSPIERQTARIVSSVPQRAKLQSVEAQQRAKLQSVEAVLHAQRTGLATSTPLNARTSEVALNDQADRQAAFNKALKQAGSCDESSAMFETVMDSSSPPLGQPVNHVNRTSFSRESLDAVVNSRGPTPTNPSATRGPTAPGLTLPPNDEFGHHSIIQTVEQGEQWQTPVTSPPPRNVWDNGRKTVLRSSQPNTGPRKLTSVTFNSSVEAFTASSMGTSNTSSQEANHQASGQFESMNVEMRRGRAPARLSTISQRSSISSRTSLPETEDLYCDDELRPELEHDPHMQLYTANMLDTDDEDPLQDFPHHPIFDHNDRESVLSMEIPSTGPQSLRSECNTDTGSVDGSESRWAEMSQGAWQEGAWHLAQDQASSKVKRSHIKELDESYLQSRDSFLETVEDDSDLTREGVEGNSDSTEYSVPVTSPNRHSVQLNSASFGNNVRAKVDKFESCIEEPVEEGIDNNVRAKVDKIESCIEESKSLSVQKGNRFRSFVQSLLDENTDNMNIDVSIEDDCNESCGDDEEIVKDSSSLNGDLSYGKKEATDNGGVEFDGWNIEKDPDSSWNDGGVDSGWNNDEQNGTECVPETLTEVYDDQFQSIIEQDENTDDNFKSLNIDEIIEDDCKSYGDEEILKDSSSLIEDLSYGEKEASLNDNGRIDEVDFDDGWNIEKDPDSSWNDCGVDSGWNKDEQNDTECVPETLTAVNDDQFQSIIEQDFDGNQHLISNNYDDWGENEENIRWNKDKQNDTECAPKTWTEVNDDQFLSVIEQEENTDERFKSLNLDVNIEDDCKDNSLNDIGRIDKAEFYDGRNSEKDADSSWNDGCVDSEWNKNEQIDTECTKENLNEVNDDQFQSIIEQDFDGNQYLTSNNYDDWGENEEDLDNENKIFNYDEGVESEWDKGLSINEPDENTDDKLNSLNLDGNIEDDCKSCGEYEEIMRDSSSLNGDLNFGENEGTDNDSDRIGGAGFDDGWNNEKDPDSSWNDGSVDKGWNKDDHNDIECTFETLTEVNDDQFQSIIEQDFDGNQHLTSNEYDDWGENEENIDNDDKSFNESECDDEDQENITQNIETDDFDQSNGNKVVNLENEESGGEHFGGNNKISSQFESAIDWDENKERISWDCQSLEQITGKIEILGNQDEEWYNKSNENNASCNDQILNSDLYLNGQDEDFGHDNHEMDTGNLVTVNGEIGDGSYVECTLEKETSGAADRTGVNEINNSTFECDTNDQFKSFSVENCKMDKNKKEDEINMSTLPINKVTITVIMTAAVIILLLLRLM